MDYIYFTLWNGGFKCSCCKMILPADQEVLDQHAKKHHVLDAESDAEKEAGKPASSKGFEDIERLFLKS